MVPDSFIREALKGELCSFADMRLHPGMRLQLERVGTSERTRHATALIGWYQESYLIVKTPLAGALMVALREAEPLVVRTMTGMHIHTFATRVIRNLRDPLFYVHLEFPMEVRAAAFRKASRVSVSLKARVTYEGEAESREVAISDLSATGAMACMAEPAGKPGDAVRIAFELPSAGTEPAFPMDLPGKVRNVRAAGKGSPGCFGIEFDAPDEDTRLRLQVYVYEKMLEGRAGLA